MSKLTEEMERCKDPRYFYVKYVKIMHPKEDRLLTEEEKEFQWDKAVNNYFGVPNSIALKTEKGKRYADFLTRNDRLKH